MDALNTEEGFESIVNVNVPESFRPRLGSARKTLPQLEQNLEAAWVESAKMLRVELVEQIDALIMVALSDAECLDALALQELLRRANNIRGMADAHGSQLTSDIAHAIFEIIESADSAKRPPKKTIGLLADGCRRLLGFDRSAKNGALDEHVQCMIRAAYLSAEASR